MKKFYVFLLMFLVTCVSVNAQVSVKGSIKSGDDSQPMAGVSVFEKGTTNGVISDLDGNYAITVSNDRATLIFSSIGFATQEKVVGAGGTVNIVLEVDQQLLDEVVVMGYSTKTRGEITSAVTTVSADKLDDITSSNIGDMLQGKVSGVSVVKGSGAPGSSPTIRIRGTSSMNAPQEPLYVVDGIIGGSYDPNDVESITVLKDAGSTGMYGAQANGGVIVVTTKKARSNKMQFNFKASLGLVQPDFSRNKRMNSAQLYNYYREYFRDPETYLVDDLAFNKAIPASVLENDTDWRGLLFRNALVQDYHFSLMGRSEKNSYYTSISYYDEQGTLRNTGYRRLNVRSNNQFKLTKWLNLTSNLNVYGSMSESADDNILYYFGQLVPWDSPYDEEGNLRPFANATGLYSRYHSVNPLFAYEGENLMNNDKGFGLDYDLTLDFKITPWLSFVSQNRVSASMWAWHYHRTTDVEHMYPGDSIEEEMSLDYGGISTNMFKADHSWKNHSISGILGYEAQMSWGNNIVASGKGLPYGLYVLDVASSDFAVGGYNWRSGMQSFISQVSYNYDKRYFVSASFRIDQSSTFNAKNRTAMFPSVSGAWVISNEHFFNNEIVTNLKLKASWGRTGMKDIGAAKFLDAFSYSSSYAGNSAAVPSQMANPDLKWEQTDQMNIGVELGILDRVSLDINAYNNITNDLLVFRDLAPSVGFQSQWQNLGSVRNTGVEAAINVTPVKTRDFSWDIDFSIAYNKNRLFGFGDQPIYKSTYEGVRQIYQDGEELYTWYLVEYAGINPDNGKMQFVKEDGTLTEDYSEGRFVKAGSPISPWQGGVSTYLKYKGFTFSANGSFVWGNELYGRKRASSLANFVGNSILPSNEDVIWQKPGDNATIGLPAHAPAVLHHTGNLVKGNYFKLNNVTLAYTLPKKVMKDMGLTLSVSCDNVFTATTVWGADPEAPMDGDVAGIIEDFDYRYPNKRQYVFSVNFTF